ncbi:MAG: sugar phosphate isomerase/epimerase family protein [Terriglobia bacterium]
MKRRDFLSRAAACWLGAGLADRAAAYAQPGPAAFAARKGSNSAARYYDVRKLYHVGVSSNSFRNYFAVTRSNSFRLPGPALALLDFPQMVADRYEVHNLEFLASHFASTEPHYLAELWRELARLHSRVINIQLDIPELNSGEGLSDPNPAVRDAAVEAVRRWIETARRLRARSVCAGPGKTNPADVSPTVEAYRRLAAYARPRDGHVLIENTAGVEPDEVLAVIRGVGGYVTGALPDFAGFASEAARVAGLRALFPRAVTLCHAVGSAFDGRGNEKTFNFQGCVEISKQLRFRGVYSVDYRGTGDSYQGVQNIINELMRDL